MRCHSVRVPAFLRASMLALVLLGLILRPALSGLSELHAVEHAVAVAVAANANADADDYAHGQLHAHSNTHIHTHTHDSTRGGAHGGADRGAVRGADGRVKHVASGVPSGDAPNGDHTSGAHGLMHQSCGPTALVLAGDIRVPPVSRHADPPSNRDRVWALNPPPSMLFRPPIG